MADELSQGQKSEVKLIVKEAEEKTIYSIKNNDVGFKTDKGVKTRRSKYTASWKSIFPEAKSLEDKSKATDVPLKYIRECYNRGMAAWRTGHRPGATQQQWGYARVHSFLLCGKTYYSTDADLVKKAKATPSAKAWWTKQKC